MAERYKVPDDLLNQLIQNALNYPDPIYMDAMGQDPVQHSLKWVAVLTECVDQIGAAAWIAGATWGLEHNTKPIKAIVTAEQYEIMTRGIKEYVEEAVDGQGELPRRGQGEPEPAPGAVSG